MSSPGEHPTAPSSFVIRGFTANQVSTLRDGIWLGPSAMVMRPQNTFNLERVELLRGPSSVINGQGAVAGTINAVTKSAEPTSKATLAGVVVVRRFNTYHAAAGINGPITDVPLVSRRREPQRLRWFRRPHGLWVVQCDGQSAVASNAEKRALKFSADYLDDDLAKYFGTPLVPASAAVEPMDVIRTPTGETIDARTRFVNYNVSDGYAQSRQLCCGPTSRGT